MSQDIQEMQKQVSAAFYNVHTSMLKMLDTFRPTDAGVALSQDAAAPELTVLRESYGLEAIAGEGDVLTRAVRVMEWFTAHVWHNGNFSLDGGHLALRALEFAFDQQDKGINCNCLARSLASCLLSLGLTARPVGIYPLAPYDNDNHFVTEVWCPEISRWVMLDPTVNAYAMDENGIPMSCLDLRKALANQQPVTFSEGLRYHGQPYSADEHRKYLAKDLFVLQFPQVSCYDTGKGRWCHLCPEGFDMQRRDMLNIEWRIRQYGDAEWMQQWLNSKRASTYQCISAEDAYRAP